MHACRAHMIDSGHTRIGTDSDTLLGEIGSALVGLSDPVCSGTLEVQASLKFHIW